jgi:hypothetical protein
MPDPDATFTSGRILPPGPPETSGARHTRCRARGEKEAEVTSWRIGMRWKFYAR